MSSFKLRLRAGGSPPSDTTPDAFTFTDVSGKTEGATVTGSAVAITGINASTAFTVSGGAVQINGAGSFVSSGNVVNNDTLTPQGTANATYLGTTNVTVTVGGVSDTFTIQTRSDPSAGFATIGPHTDFDGTAGSGDAAPSGSDTRTKTDPPMAIGRIATYPGQRVSGPILLKIPCDAYGGIDRVELSGDCAPTTISGMSLVDFVDVNGVSRKEFYHGVYLDTAAFVAKGGADSTRRANIYAKVYATDGDITPRVLSWWFIPAASEFDATYTVGSGKTFATIKGALNQAQADGRKNPNIEIWTTAFYEMEDSTWGTYTGGFGHAVITARPGVTATIGRAAGFNTTTDSANWWTPGWDGIEFRGAGIVIDTRNVTKIVTTTKPCFVNGAKLTNSVGTRDSLYWNKGPRPAFGFSVASWWQYHDFEFGAAATQFQLGVVGGTSRSTMGDIYTGTPLVYGCHDEDSNGEFFTATPQALTVRYSGSGSATIAKTGGNGAGTLELVDPAGTLSIPLGGVYDLVLIESVAALINARSGWAATTQDTTRAARFLIGNGFGTTNGFTAVDAKTADVLLATKADLHADGTQTYGGKENFIYWNWTFDQADGTNVISNFLFFDGQTNPAGTLEDRDMSFVNCILLGNSGTISVNGTGCHHKLFRHLTTEQFLTPGAGTLDDYTVMESCLISGVGTFGDPAAGPPINFRNNVHLTQYGAIMYTGATWVNNTSLGPTKVGTTLIYISNYLAAPLDHDFTPTGTALSTLKPSAFPYDARGVLRSASDCAGAWSKNAA